MDLTGQRRVPYVDAGRGHAPRAGELPQWNDPNPMVTIPLPQPQAGFVPPGVEYADDPMIRAIIEEHQRRQRTRIPIHPLDLMTDDLRGRQ